MESKNRYDGVDPRAVSTIRHHARCLARTRAVPGMDAEDLEQDLVLDLLHRQRHYDPHRASFATFADRIIRNRVASLTAPTLRLRTERAMASLDEPVAGDDGEPDACRADRLADDAGLHPDPLSVPDEDIGLRRDVAAFVSRLSPALRRCAAIIVADNVVAAARAAGLHRSTVYEAARRLREAALRAGLDLYLGRTPTGGSAAR